MADTCATCGQSESGECPRCYLQTGVGCPHGDLCAACRDDLAKPMPEPAR